ncbi:MAG: M48 family metalloprotease [Deltaproteobacteria bacterium]|nr:M48 family metalloprotease [Deltaproteobacteria bacterium]
MSKRASVVIALLGALVALGAAGCNKHRPAQTAGYPPPGGPGPYGPSPYYPGTPAPGPGPAAPPVTPPPPAPPPLPPQPPVYNDPINNLDLGWLRQRAQQVLSELVAALAPDRRALVQNIPLIVDPTVGEVNAFAACSDGRAAMAISDGLLEIEAQMSQCRATDELFGTRKLDAYVQLVATQQRPDQPIVRPAPGFYDQAQQVEGRKVLRQHQLMDEQLGFVLGHELAHHYLLHTGCVGGGGGISPDNIGRILSNVVPTFNQPNEIAADTTGVDNVLTAGARRPDYHYTEGGALMTLDFFSALQQLSPEAVLFAFQSSHPPPQVRRPLVQQAAAQWRARGGAPAPPSPLPLPFPIPIPGFG